MILYQIFKNNSLVKDKATLGEAYALLPAGSKLISGNTTKSKKKPEGGLETVEEIKTVFQVPCNRPKYTIIQI